LFNKGKDMAKIEAKEVLAKGRVLTSFTHNGNDYVCNDIFTGNADEIKYQKEAGTIDTHTDAVKYAEGLKG
jgi:hypothetical protein